VTTTTLTLTALGFVSDGLNIFNRTMSDSWDMYTMPVTPAKWVYNLSVICIIMEFLIILYGIYCLFDVGLRGKRIVHDSDWINPFVYISFCVASIFYIVYLFAWDACRFHVALVILLMITALYYCISILITNAVVTTSEDYIRARRHKQVYVMNMLLNNASTAIATCFTIDVVATVAVVIAFSVKTVDRLDSVKNIVSIVTFSLMLALLIGYIIMDAMLIKTRTLNIVAPYVMVIFYAAGILDNNFSLRVTSIIAGTLLVLSSLVLIFKSILIIKKQKAYSQYRLVSG
jgi:hypothetical protein